MGTPRPTEVTRDFTSTRPTEVTRDPCGQGYGCDLRRCQWCNGRCIDEHKPCPTDFRTPRPTEVTRVNCTVGRGVKDMLVGHYNSMDRCRKECALVTQWRPYMKGFTFNLDPPGDCWCIRDTITVGKSQKWYRTCSFAPDFRTPRPTEVTRGQYQQQ